jgi:hypothetical protein
MADRENLGGMVHALRNMQRALRQWTKDQFGAVLGELNDLRKQLEEVKSRTVICWTEVCAITNRMDELLYREEMMWLQRSIVSSMATRGGSQHWVFPSSSKVARPEEQNQEA